MVAWVTLSGGRLLFVDIILVPLARLAQSVERKALNLVVVGSSPTVGDINFYVTPLKLWRKTTSLGNRHVQNSV